MMSASETMIVRMGLDLRLDVFDIGERRRH